MTFSYLSLLVAAMALLLLWSGVVKAEDAVEAGNHLKSDPESLDLLVGQKDRVTFAYTGHLISQLNVNLESSAPSYVGLQPSTIVFTPTNPNASIEVEGLQLSSMTFIDVLNCTTANGTIIDCPFKKSDIYIRVKVLRSNAISVLVIVTGWIYFTAWSISFYPQVILNWERKSVIGLNFDFLVLNILGFSCYTIYNVLMLYDPYVQEIYVATHARALIPVLLNDVVFAVHALLISMFTGFQCLIYERGSQRVSYICRGWSSLLVVFCFISLGATLLGFLNWLQFIKYLSGVKMAVTLTKYSPQAILNFKRKSTVGWSIGNVLLDFSGGLTDILQMILQAVNTDDWSAFYGNPVKFGLGLTSMVFDVVFMFQHYVLYPHNGDANVNAIPAYDEIADGSDTSNPTASAPTTTTINGSPADVGRRD